MAARVFISYASADKDRASAISRGLEQCNIQCWIAPRDIRPGFDWDEEILDALDSCAGMVLLLSERSNESVHVKHEAERAASSGKSIFTVRIEEVLPSKKLKFFISTRQWLDMWPDLGIPIETLANALQGSLLNPPQDPVVQQSRQFSRSVRTPSRGMVVGGLGVLLTLVISGLYWQSHNTFPPINSIAILPITNVGADATADYLSDGITETLINSLSKIRTLQVMSRSAVFRFKTSKSSPMDQGKALHVNTILTGTIRDVFGQIELSVELVEVNSGRQLWGERYRQPSSDLLRLQQTAVAAVANQLRVRLDSQDTKQVTKDYTTNVDAYRLYLKGRYEWNKRNIEGYEKAADYFREAIDHDPTYALAYSGLADAYSFRTGLRESDEIFPIARAAATKALDLDSSLAEGHASLAFVLMQYAWDWAGVERELKKALELNPSYASAHSMYGRLLTATARFPEAKAEILRGQQLDPLSMGIANGLAFHYYLSRQYELAERQFKRNLSIDPTFSDTQSLLAYTYVQQNRLAEAIRQYEQLLAKNPDDLGTIPDLARAYALVGRKRDAMHLLARLQQMARKEYIIPTLFAEIHAALGESDTAFEYLDRAYRERVPQLILLRVEPVWDPLRADVRFQQLLAKMKLL